MALQIDYQCQLWFRRLIIVGQLIHFLGWGNWQAYTLIVPVALFFWLVIKKFEDWSKAKCILTIVGFFIIFFGMVIGAFSMVTPEATSADWSLLLAHTLKTLMVAVTLIVVAVLKVCQWRLLFRWHTV